MRRQRNAEEYLSKVRLLNEKGDYDGALKLAQEGLFYWMEKASEFYLEMEKTYIALGDHVMVSKMDLEAMRALYWKNSKVTDKQRAEANPPERKPTDTREP